jgi:hypothetical protein
MAEQIASITDRCVAGGQRRVTASLGGADGGRQAAQLALKRRPSKPVLALEPRRRSRAGLCACPPEGCACRAPTSSNRPFCLYGARDDGLAAAKDLLQHPGERLGMAGDRFMIAGNGHRARAQLPGQRVGGLEHHLPRP